MTEPDTVTLYEARHLDQTPTKNDTDIGSLELHLA
jgi:hypothetical protein